MDTISKALADLQPYIAAPSLLPVREILELVYDAGQDDLIADLISSEDAAALWHVTDRHARRIIAESNAGFRVGRAWLVRRSFAERHIPRPPGRPSRTPPDA